MQLPRKHAAMLSERDDAILETLSVKVRLLTLEQIAGVWWTPTPTGIANARKRLARLRSMGLIESWQVKAHPLLSLESPVITWIPGEPRPNFGAASYEFQTRWKEAPKTTTVWVASKRCLAHFGAIGTRFGHPLQATHDLHVSAVYLRVRALSLSLAATWTGEDERERKRGVKHPDAVIQNAEGRIELIIEFGGAYPAERVQEFHEHCEMSSVAYQMW
jgi:hypothetical protein